VRCFETIYLLTAASRVHHGGTMNRQSGFRRAAVTALLALALAGTSACSGDAGHDKTAPAPVRSASAASAASSASPAASPAASGARYPVVPTRRSDPQQADQLLQKLQGSPPGSNVTPPAVSADLMVLRPLTGNDADAAWLPDSSSVCVAAFQGLDAPSGKGTTPEVASTCLGLPERSRADPPLIVGPRNLSTNDRAQDWFAVVIGSTDPVTVQHNSGGAVDPLHQVTAKAANGVVYTVVEYHALDYPNGTPSPEPTDIGVPQLCTGSGQACREALKNG
jgi:hypothetical protein